LLAQNDGEPRREVDVILRQAGQMAKLLDDLLEASRITQNKITLDKRVVDLREVVNDAIQAVTETFSARSISLGVSIPETPLLVDGDPVRLQQIFVNLLGNAAKYTPAAGHTHIAASEDGGRVVVTVRDSGAGIEPRLLGPIFDMFFQGETGLFRSDSSMGLGLALVRSLVEMHGGQVAAYSAGRGHGSTFTVRLPLESVRAPSPPPTPRRRIQWREGKRVALIDDNVDSSAMLQAVLSRAGYEVHCAHDGLAGIDLVERLAPDVALIDIGLPGTDGYEVARRLRALDKHREIYLVAFTGYGRPADRALALQAGFDEHVTKPLRPDELSELLEQRS
jgi:two-component system CheB/CheR fusion protein